MGGLYAASDAVIFLVDMLFSITPDIENNKQRYFHI